ncbi:MAG: hypothetical protein F6J87_28165 [Spirulina sp. SIO3F2]|nr:hypothetical protein [Spirulina sp. SIO3F2]
MSQKSLIRSCTIYILVALGSVVFFSLTLKSLGIVPTILLGCLVIGLSTVLSQGGHYRRGGRNIAKSMAETLLESEHILELVEPKQFPWLDYAFYERVTQEMQALGLSAIADIEDCTISQSAPNQRFFFRVFVHSQGEIAAICSHLRIRGFNGWLAKWMGGVQTDIKLIEFSSTYSDGGVVDTSNAKDAPTFDQPDWRSQRRLPADTAIAHQYEVHQKHLTEYQQHHPNAEVVKISNYTGFYRLYQDELRRSSEWRKNRGGSGITAEEVKRIAGPKLQDTAHNVVQAMEEEGLLGKNQEEDY